MPDGSFASQITAPSLPDLTTMSALELGKQSTRLYREHQRLSEIGGSQLACMDLSNCICDIDTALIAAEPHSLADAVAMLVAIGGWVRDAFNTEDYRALTIDSWLAMGRVVKFLADSASVEVDDVGGAAVRHSVNGLDPHFRVMWWIERALDVGATLFLSERGAVNYLMPDDSDSDPVRAEIISLIAERSTLDEKDLKCQMTLLAWHGLGAKGICHNVIDGRRWAVAASPSGAERRVVTTAMPGAPA